VGPDGRVQRSERADYLVAMSTISVVVPCHNGEAYLEEALSSIGDQTRAPDEVIVVDDGSTDRSAAIARRAGATVLQQPNRGEGSARNRGIQHARGDLVAFLDADDRWLPHHLETIGGLLDDHPDATVACGAVQQFGTAHDYRPGYVRPGPPTYVLDAAFRDWLHLTIGAVIRREALLEIGGFDEEERYSVDFDLWLRLALDHRFVATDQVTSEWRWHPGQQSATPLRQDAAVYRFRRRFIEMLEDRGDPRCARLEHLFNRVWLRDLRAASIRQPDLRRVWSLAQFAPQVRPYRGIRPAQDVAERPRRLRPTLPRGASER
jgi:glycosyltransferase involved in cell wall biosynthesis